METSQRDVRMRDGTRGIWERREIGDIEPPMVGVIDTSNIHELETFQNGE